MTRGNVPKLRFGGFVGEWEIQKLGELGSFSGGGTPSTTNESYWKGNIPWISSSDIYEDDLHSINTHRFLSEVAINESATKIIPKNSILLVSRVGVGKLAVNKVELCTSQDFSNFIPLKSNSYFIGYYLIARKNILVNFSQGTSIKGFTTSDVKELNLNIPTLPEQQKIAAFLTVVDEKIQQLSLKKELLEQYKKGVMQQLFSGKLRFKEENGKEFGDWEEKKLGEIGKFYAGGDLDKLNYSKFKNSEFYYPIYANGSGEGIYGYATTFQYKANCITVSGRGNLGYAKIRTQNFNAIVRLIVIEPKDLIEPKYLEEIINQTNFAIESTGVPQLTVPQIKSYKIPVPSFPEQQKIADFLSSIDAKIKSTNQQITQMQSFKKGLLQQLFI